MLWEYVLEPENKAAFWDHVAFSTAGRRARGRTTVSVEEHQGSKKALDVIKEIDAPTNLQRGSSSSIEVLEPPIAKDSEMGDDDDDNVPIYKLLNLKASEALENPSLAANNILSRT